MISNLGWIAVLIILGIIYILCPADNEDECYKKDSYTCLNCKKNCKWHDVVEKFENNKMKNR